MPEVSPKSAFDFANKKTEKLAPTSRPKVRSTAGTLQSSGSDEIAQIRAEYAGMIRMPSDEEPEAAPSARRSREGTMEIDAVSLDEPSPLSDTRPPPSDDEDADDDTADLKRPAALEAYLEESVDAASGEAAPAAMRPIGRLGGDDGGWSMALDFREVSPLSDTAPDEGDMPRLPGGQVCEADRLDAWLDAIDGESPERRGGAVPATQLPGTMDVAALFGNLDGEVLPFDNTTKLKRDEAPLTPSPVETGPATPSFAVQPPREALPFAGAPPAPIPAAPIPAAPIPAAQVPAAADQLESWLRGHLDDRMPAPATPAPVAPVIVAPQPQALAPNPIADARTPPPIVDQTVEAKEEESGDDGPPIPIEIYAKVKVSIWDRGLDLMDAIGEAEIEEPVWRDNEVRMAEALALEAQDGEATLANAVRAAIRKLRSDVQESVALPIAKYAEARVAIERAKTTDEAEELVLARLELSPEEWESARQHWTKRARGDAALARKIRREVARARREAKAKQREEEADEASSAPVV